MTKTEVKEFLPIMQAFAEGKAIQYYSQYSKCWMDWYCSDLDIAQEYRIKPEPKYHPFENKEECFIEMKKHEPFGWVKIDETYKSIASLQEKYLYLNGENSLRHYSTLLRDAIFVDGQPFGIKVDE
jgi:hypothetical protein